MNFYVMLSLPTLDGLWKIAVFLIMISVIVTLHEFGHYIIARWNRVRVLSFAVGMGPTILKWTSKRSGISYRLNVLPIGGYCSMKGEDLAGSGKIGKPSDKKVEPEKIEDDHFSGETLISRKPWQRLAIVVAGPIANFITAIAIFIIGGLLFGVPSSGDIATVVGTLDPSYPAIRAGLLPGDQITTVDGIKMGVNRSVFSVINIKKSGPVNVVYLRDGQSHQTMITPMVIHKKGKVAFRRLGIVFKPVYHHVNPVESVSLALSQFSETTLMQINGYRAIFSRPTEIAGQMSGVVGMAQVSAEVQDQGWPNYLQFTAIVSIAIGILNLLPFPALDGGRAIFILVEMVRGKPVEPKKEALVHLGGLALLMCLMLGLAYHDILNLLTKTS